MVTRWQDGSWRYVWLPASVFLCRSGGRGGIVRVWVWETSQQSQYRKPPLQPDQAPWVMPPPLAQEQSLGTGVRAAAWSVCEGGDVGKEGRKPSGRQSSASASSVLQGERVNDPWKPCPGLSGLSLPGKFQSMVLTQNWSPWLWC